jgi:hypothetical protein
MHAKEEFIATNLEQARINISFLGPSRTRGNRGQLIPSYAPRASPRIWVASMGRRVVGAKNHFPTKLIFPIAN